MGGQGGHALRDYAPEMAQSTETARGREQRLLLRCMLGPERERERESPTYWFLPRPLPVLAGPYTTRPLCVYMSVGKVLVACSSLHIIFMTRPIIRRRSLMAHHWHDLLDTATSPQAGSQESTQKQPSLTSIFGQFEWLSQVCWAPASRAALNFRPAKCRQLTNKKSRRRSRFILFPWAQDGSVDFFNFYSSLQWTGTQEPHTTWPKTNSVEHHFGVAVRSAIDGSQRSSTDTREGNVQKTTISSTTAVGSTDQSKWEETGAWAGSPRNRQTLTQRRRRPVLPCRQRWRQ